MGGGGGEKPKEDPAVKEMREREQKRAEAEKAKQIQRQMAEETALLNARGSRSLLGPLGASNASSRSLLGGG